MSRIMVIIVGLFYCSSLSFAQENGSDPNAASSNIEPAEAPVGSSLNAELPESKTAAQPSELKWARLIVKYGFNNFKMLRATEVSQSELFALGKAHEKLNAVISKIDANPTNEKLMTEYDKVSGEVGDSSSTKVLLSPFIGLAPGMSFTNTKGKNETNPIKLKEAFDSIGKLLKENNPSTCFPSFGKFSSTLSCRTVLPICAKAGFGSADKKLYIEEIQDDATLNQLLIDQREEYTDRTGKGKQGTYGGEHADFQYSFCALVALSGLEFKPLTPAIVSQTPPQWAKWKDTNTLSEAILKNCTKESMPSKEVSSKMTVLQSRFETWPFMNWVNALKWKVKSCNKWVPEFCKNVRIIKNTAILSYETKGCSIRSVTVNDIQRDLQRWRNIGAEEAAILEHSEIAEKIESCESAKDAGFEWFYESPTLEQCKK